MKDRIEIVASGFGGQGVVRLGQIIGEAGVKQGLRVAMLKSHGTEMRGGYVRSQVVLSEDPIDSPMCESPDYFIALSGAAYERFKDTVSNNGIILYDPAFVEEIDETLHCTQKSFPAKEGKCTAWVE
jgi:2-oxoglutarate ferredoxin oxidoreductase subunit gamma